MPVFEAALISEEAVHRELWISFCSLVRSYIAAAQIGLEAAVVLVAQPQENRLELVSSEQVVKIEMEPGRAEGYWAIYKLGAADDDAPLADGAFRIGLDSLIEWTGLPGRQEMDEVAEALASLIVE